MRLLIDQNLSRHLVRRLGSEFPDSTHVADVGLDVATDRTVWEYARREDLVVVPKDNDFAQLALRSWPRRCETTKPPGSMPSSGDVVDLELGIPEGREAGFRHPAVVVTSQRILDVAPSVVQVVPLTTTIRGFHSEIVITPDDLNGLDDVSAAPCQHIRAVSPRRIVDVRGNVGSAMLARLRDTIAVILDLP